MRNHTGGEELGPGSDRPPPPKAEEWLAAARAGSREALGQGLEGYRGFLLAIANQEMDTQLQAKGGASDVVQQTFLEAYRDFGHFKGNTEGEFKSWLRRLLHNNLLNFKRLFRKGKRRADREVPLDTGDSSRPAPATVDQGSSPSAQLTNEEQKKALERAVERLPEEYRQVIDLRYREELSFTEIGRRMGRTANAAQKLWVRAVERLQRELEGPA